MLVAERAEWHEQFRPCNRFSYDEMMRFNAGFAVRFAALYAAIGDAWRNEASDAS